MSNRAAQATIIHDIAEEVERDRPRPARRHSETWPRDPAPPTTEDTIRDRYTTMLRGFVQFGMADEETIRRTLISLMQELDAHRETKRWPGPRTMADPDKAESECGL